MQLSVVLNRCPGNCVLLQIEPHHLLGDVCKGKGGQHQANAKYQDRPMMCRTIGCSAHLKRLSFLLRPASWP